MLWSELYFRQLECLRAKLGDEAAKEWNEIEHEGGNDRKRYDELEKILIENGLGMEVQSWIHSDGFEFYGDGRQVFDENGKPKFHEWAAPGKNKGE